MATLTRQALAAATPSPPPSHLVGRTPSPPPVNKRPSLSVDALICSRHHLLNFSHPRLSSPWVPPSSRSSPCWSLPRRPTSPSLVATTWSSPLGRRLLVYWLPFRLVVTFCRLLGRHLTVVVLVASCPACGPPVKPVRAGRCATMHRPRQLPPLVKRNTT